MKFQTRSEENGLTYFSTLKEAIEAWKNDPSVWKISFVLETGERVRLVYDIDFDKWVYEPIKLEI